MSDFREGALACFGDCSDSQTVNGGMRFIDFSLNLLTYGHFKVNPEAMVLFYSLCFDFPGCL